MLGHLCSLVLQYHVRVAQRFCLILDHLTSDIHSVIRSYAQCTTLLSDIRSQSGLPVSHHFEAFLRGSVMADDC